MDNYPKLPPQIRDMEDLAGFMLLCILGMGVFFGGVFGVIWHLHKAGVIGK